MASLILEYFTGFCTSSMYAFIELPWRGYILNFLYHTILARSGFLLKDCAQDIEIRQGDDVPHKHSRSNYYHSRIT